MKDFEWSDLVPYGALAAMIGVVCLSFISSNVGADRCEAKGGVWVSHPAQCFSRGAIIDIDAP